MTNNVYDTSVKRFSSRNPLLWGAASILFGVLLIAWQGDLLNKLVLVLGILALVVSVAQFFSFMKVTKGMNNRWSFLPVGTVVAFILGVLLVASPSMWVNVVMILLGVMVLLLGVSSIVSLVTLKKVTPIKWWYFIFPVLQIIAGAMIVSEPSFLANFIMIFTGVWIILHGVSEFVGYFILKPKA